MTGIKKPRIFFDKDKNLTLELPDELGLYLVDKLKARYQKYGKVAALTANIDSDGIRRYLGTFFPRSFAESYLIYGDILDYSAASRDNNLLVAKEEKIDILSFGCGTGGDIAGSIYALLITRPKIKTIEVTGIDVNEEALDTAANIIDYISKMAEKDIIFNPIVCNINNKVDRKFLVQRLSSYSFDFVQSFKAVSELPRDTQCPWQYYNVYEKLTAFLIPRIKTNGLFILLDICAQDPVYHKHLPFYMNKQLSEFVRENKDFSTLLPRPCAMIGSNTACNNCFTEKIFYVSQFLCDSDASKVTFRVLGRTDFVRKFTSKFPRAIYIRDFCHTYRCHCLKVDDSDPVRDAFTLLNLLNIG